MKIFLHIVFCLLFVTSLGQERRKCEALRINQPMTIDGHLDEQAWKNAAPADSFIQKELKPGAPATEFTEARIVYDDAALYIGAMCYDQRPDSILRELSVRDNEANADLFGVILDTYNDDINAFGFFVTAAGVQLDARYSTDGQDFDWNAVWTSAISKTDKGWQIEFRIPFSMIRFGKEEIQDWGINFVRKIRRKRENTFFSPIDPNIPTFIGQFADLVGISHIDPPLRLSITPYLSSQVRHYPQNGSFSKDSQGRLSGGLDVKYGLSEAFTLDMTLIPDFSQVQSDNKILNLGPFEVQYQERRPFFTEGTELFNKGDLFYSRRIGGTPMDIGQVYDNLQAGEEIISNPNQTQLINASKISGRTTGNLGIGFFNAVTGNTYAEIKTNDGQIRKVLTNPRSNYNIFVFDQALKNNSSISFINTNVMREGEARDANVSSLNGEINSNENKYKVYFGGALSQLFNPGISKPETGRQGYISAGKSDGNFRCFLNANFSDESWDPNDMGINFMNNRVAYSTNFIYNIYTPFWKVNNCFNSLNFEYTTRFNPGTYTGFVISGDHMANFSKRFLAVGLGYYVAPFEQIDIYLPRVPGYYYRFPKNFAIESWLSSDYRKPWAIDLSGGFAHFDEEGRFNYRMETSPRWRASNKLNFIFENSLEMQMNDKGFVDYTGDSLIFGNRDVANTEHVLNINYKFTSRMALTMRARYNWGNATYDQLFNLEKNGYLTATNGSYEGDNYSVFNMDMVFFWQFAPGSELNFVWKNMIENNTAVIGNSYFRNLNHTFASPQLNTITLKILYFLDYQTVKSKLKRSS